MATTYTCSECKAGADDRGLCERHPHAATFAGLDAATTDKALCLRLARAIVTLAREVEDGAELLAACSVTLDAIEAGGDLAGHLPGTGPGSLASDVTPAERAREATRVLRDYAGSYNLVPTMERLAHALDSQVYAVAWARHPGPVDEEEFPLASPSGKLVASEGLAAERERLGAFAEHLTGRRWQR